MTAAPPAPRLASQIINGILAIRPLAAVIKKLARDRMINRAETIGVYWRKEVQALRSRQSEQAFSSAWDTELTQIQNPDLTYPDYYLRSFHAYESGNLSWDAAMEVEVAAYAVHAKIWQAAGANGDAMLRQSYHTFLKQQLPNPPQRILDLGCSVGMSTVALQALYPDAEMTGIDLSPYFLAIAQYRHAHQSIQWLHRAGENTGFPDASFDLVSIHLVFHELPTEAAIAILQEARRLLRPGGHIAIMDMNPQSETFRKLPPYVLTLLKSTEPYLDQYFALNIEQALIDAGFASPAIAENSPRHRTAIAQVR
jgi:SAM-dependent methyltransferase